MPKSITINGDLIHDIPSFYEEINRIFMAEEDWKIGNSLDAFDDMLYGGFGIIKANESVQLHWLNSENSRKALGFELTQKYYSEKLKAVAYNKKIIEEKLSALEKGTGQTYFEILLEIISDHKNIHLNLY